MKIMRYHTDYDSNIYQTLTKSKHNRQMVGKIYLNMKLTPPFTPLLQYN